MSKNHNANLALWDLCQSNPRHSLVLSRDEQVHELEALKCQSKRLFMGQGIPMPAHEEFDSLNHAWKHLPHEYPYLIKTDGPVGSELRTLLITSCEEVGRLPVLAKSLVSLRTDRHYKCLREQYIDGYEYSVIILMNKVNWINIGSANDYKRLENSGQGLNSNGMGSIYPARTLHEDTDRMLDRVVRAVLIGYPDYAGFLTCQFIVDSKDHSLYLLEVNARLCDPEFQSIGASLDCQLLDRLAECLSLQTIQPIEHRPTHAVTVSLLHENWPDHTGWTKILPGTVLPTIPAGPFKVYNATDALFDARHMHMTITNSGARSHEQLAREIYDYLSSIDTKGLKYRTDIGLPGAGKII